MAHCALPDADEPAHSVQNQKHRYHGRNDRIHSGSHRHRLPPGDPYAARNACSRRPARPLLIRPMSTEAPCPILAAFSCRKGGIHNSIYGGINQSTAPKKAATPEGMAAFVLQDSPYLILT